MSALYTYTIDDIRANFSEKDYARGAAYAKQKRVKHWVFDNQGTLTAHVQGSEDTPYTVEVQVTDGRRNKKLHGYCSCPLGAGCKHIVAALLIGMDSSSSPLPAHNVMMQKPSVPKLDPAVSRWLEMLQKPEEESASSSPSQGKLIIYTIEKPKGDEAYIVSPMLASILKNGNFGSLRKPFGPSELSPYSIPEYVKTEDVTILQLISSLNPRHYGYDNNFKIPTGKVGTLLLNMLLATGRCFSSYLSSPKEPFTMGAPKQGTITWKTQTDGSQTLQLTIEGMLATSFLALEPPYYLCPHSRTIGPLDIGLPDKQATALLKAPPLNAEQAGLVSEKLASMLDNAAPSWLPVTLPIRTTHIKPVPYLQLTAATIQPQKSDGWRMKPSGEPVTIPAAKISFDYGSKRLTYHDKTEEIRRLKEGEVQVIPRDTVTEDAIMNMLPHLGLGLELGAASHRYKIKQNQQSLLTIGESVQNFHKNKALPEKWEHFMQVTVPRLKEQGWKVVMDNHFPYNVVQADDEWYAEIEEGSGIDWFSIELGVTVDGRRLNLMPILIDLLKKDHDILKTIAKLPEKEPLLVTIGEGQRLALPSARVRLLLTMIQHLYSSKNSVDDAGKLHMQTLDAALLAEMEAAASALDMRWFGGEKIRTLGKKLKEFTQITQVNPPASFKGELRHYQQEGLSWLQFLREYDLAGILADDMGLGKTIQVLAHIATEKAAGRLKHPFLVVAPTSLMVNWKMEAARFVPDVKVLTLHGAKRSEHFKDIMQYDLVLTTYPLLPRDKDVLLDCQYHTVILDEAQTIKNARTKLTQIACQLKAGHRLCMTGTPLENHLGELWSLFHFLLPGYLGSSQQFGALFRTPIEKGGDHGRAEILQRRVKPFILRRTKKEVVTELPPKTEIIRRVALEGAQRDLYETIRVSMHEKVRQEISAKGLGKSHIIVLDALLKLRQACCDPLLLTIDNAKEIGLSAKKDDLMEILPTMIEEGRKILLFSQFTSMLALIEKELSLRGIPYVILTGQTTDRETPVRTFQEGKVPLFLISLKAGGTGLNLTAADTVIHYDPWWNPAVENQATDRAYRIGQDKPVFVYKLIAAGTVEEKIIEMQDKKRALMDSLFDPAAKAAAKLSAGDIQTLFEPLE